MKKLITALFSLFLLTPSFAAIPTKEQTRENAVQRVFEDTSSINPRAESIATILNAHFPDRQNAGNALAQYHYHVQQNQASGVTGIMAAQIWDVCMAGGLDIKSADGKKKCEIIAYALARDYQQVCDYDGKNCIKDFKGVKTQMRTGTFIAKAWAKSQKNDTIICQNGFRGSWNDDYMACHSVIDPFISYEFQFDSLTASNDVSTEKGFHEAACALAGLKFRSRGRSVAGDAETGIVMNSTSWDDHCPTKDSSLCAKVDKFSKELGFNASYSNHESGCVFSSNTVIESQIINEYAGVIDNFVFSSSSDQTQIQASTTLDETIRMYAQSCLGATPITTFDCDKTHKRWIRSGLLEDPEDVLTCRINGKRVDFVFDDLTQATALWGNALIKGSQQGLDCRAFGGVYDGEVCAMLTQAQCEQVKKLNAQNCPFCSSVVWNDEKQICELPASAHAKSVQTVTRVTATVGGAVAAVVLAIPTGGASLSAGVVFVSTVIGSSAMITSEIMDVSMEYQQDKWIEEMNRIVMNGTPEDAEKFLRENLQTMMGADDLDERSRNGLDEVIARVLQNAPDEYYQEIADGCTVQESTQCPVDAGPDEAGNTLEDEMVCTTLSKIDRSLPTCALNPDNGKNTLQTIKNVADGVAFVAGVVTIVASLVNFVKSSKTITDKIDDVEQVVDDLKKNGWIKETSGHWQNRTTGEIVYSKPGKSTAGWKYIEGTWKNQKTGQVVSRLPKGEIGWNPNANLNGGSGGRWHCSGCNKNGSGNYRGSLIKDIHAYVRDNHITREVTRTVTTNAWNPNWRGVAAGTILLANSGDGTNPANVQIPDRTTDVPPVDTTPAGIPVTDTAVDLPGSVAPITINMPGKDVPPVDTTPAGIPVTDTAADLPGSVAPITINMPGKSEPAKPAQPQTPPVQTVPVETEPVYTAPVETNPVYTAPVETMTEQPTPVQYMPVQTTYSQPTPVYTPETSRDIKPHQVKNNGAKTALIATAAIAGTIGAGWLIGGLIGKDDDDNKTTSAPVAPQVDPELERLMQNAGGVIGVINGQSLKLIPLPTTINSYAPIVDINGKAVVVVDYRGYRLPYYMNPMTMRWEPLLGIGVNAGWFNVYPNPSQSGIAIIDSISGQLVQKLKPSVVSRYVGNYATGTRFPMAGPAAYQTINAEFPNGVVNTNTGAMSPSDQLLYNNNYQLIQQKLR